MNEELREKGQQLLAKRRKNYKLIFDPKLPGALEILADLAAFCRANESTFHLNERAHALAEGRREVWLRIQHFLQLDSEQQWKLYGRKDL